MHFKWHHRNLSKNGHESLERKRIMNRPNNTILVYWLQPWSASATTIGGQARDSRDKSECDSAVCSSLHGTQHRVAIWSFSIFLTGTVQLFLPGPDDFCWGPAPVGPTLVTGSINYSYRAIQYNSLTWLKVKGELAIMLHTWRDRSSAFSNVWMESDPFCPMSS